MTRRFDTDDYSNLYWGVSFTTFGVYAFGPERCTIHYCNMIYNAQYKIATKFHWFKDSPGQWGPFLVSGLIPKENMGSLFRVSLSALWGL